MLPILTPVSTSPHRSHPAMALRYAPYLRRVLLPVHREFCAETAAGWMLQAVERSE